MSQASFLLLSVTFAAAQAAAVIGAGAGAVVAGAGEEVGEDLYALNRAGLAWRWLPCEVDSPCAV